MLERIKKVKFNSIRFKVSLFYTAILGVILVIYSIILYIGQRYTLYRDLDRELTIKAQEITSAINSFLPALQDDQRAFRSIANLVIRQQGTYPAQEKIAEARKQWLAMRQKLNLGDDYIVLADIDGKVIANSPNADGKILAELLNGPALSGQKTVLYRTLKFKPLRLRAITMPYYYKNKRAYSIQIGSSLAPIYGALYGRLFFSLLMIPLVLIFASFIGGIITKRILKPVTEVASIAKNITSRDLSARVKVGQADEEFRYLVDAFNEMISRLENSFRYIDEFSSNVAHELKTPLTIISGESELALMQERDIQEYKRVVEVNFKEAGHMLKIVEDLLLLSRLEYQPEAFKFEPVVFSEFLTDVFEQAKKLAKPKDISVGLALPDKKITIMADWLHLRRLFINLVNNAVKFTPQGGRIKISAKIKDKKVSVSVSDSGMGIAPEDAGKIFDRFFRVNPDGHTSQGSSGLGLSIAQSIAKIHRGEISVTSQLQKGATFTVTLPV